MKFVDSTFIISLLRSDRSTIEKARELDEAGGAATTAINVYEVAYGAQRHLPDVRKGVSELDRVLLNMEVYPLNYEAAEKAAEIAGSLDRRGVSIGALDSLVAAIALVNGADTLVTRNVSHFEWVSGLKIEKH